jgi:hypothetical protein
MLFRMCGRNDGRHMMPNGGPTTRVVAIIPAASLTKIVPIKSRAFAFFAENDGSYCSMPNQMSLPYERPNT